MTAELVALEPYRFWRRYIEQARPGLSPTELVTAVRDFRSQLRASERQERRSQHDR